MTKKTFFYLMFISMVVFFSSYTESVLSKSNKELVDKIVAIVNGDVITQSELDKKISWFNQQASEIKIRPSELRQKVLDSMIDALLQLQLAKNHKMQVSERELDGIVANIAKSNNLTIEQFKQTLKERENIGYKEYRQQLTDQVTISRVQHQFLGREIIVNEKETAELLRNPQKLGASELPYYHTIDILVAVADNASSAQVKVATEAAVQITKKIQQGGSLETITKEYEARGQQIISNDLGWRRANELPDLFIKEVTSIKTGQVTKPIQAPNGIHILKLLEIKGGQPQKVKLTEDQAKEIIFRRKLEEKVKPWLKELRDAAYIKIF